MAFHLVVSEPFRAYARGDHITDAAEIAAILAGHEEAFVRRVAAPDEPKSEG